MNPDDSLPDLLTVAEVADLFRISERVVYRLVKAGKLTGPPIRPIRIYKESYLQLKGKGPAQQGPAPIEVADIATTNPPQPASGQSEELYHRPKSRKQKRSPEATLRFPS